MSIKVWFAIVGLSAFAAGCSAETSDPPVALVDEEKLAHTKGAITVDGQMEEVATCKVVTDSCEWQEFPGGTAVVCHSHWSCD